MHRLTQSQKVAISMEEAWKFLTNSKNLDEVTPPKYRFETISGGEEPMFPGQIIVHRMRLAPMIYRNWVTEIKHIDPGKSFIDEQRSGPYKFWHHRHLIESDGEHTIMHDDIHYALPLAPFSEIAHVLHVRPLMKKLFDYRREALDRLFNSGS